MLPTDTSLLLRVGMEGSKKVNKFLVILALSLVAGFGAVGCSTPGDLHLRMGRDFVEKGVWASPAMKVAVLPFTNWTDNPHAGGITARLFASELYHRQLFSVMEPAETEQGLGAMETPQGAFRQDLAQETGRRLGVDAVVVGSVSEFAYQHGLREEPAVGLSIRLVRVDDGKLLWTASHSEIGSGWWRRDSLNLTAQRVVARMLDTLESDLEQGPPPGEAP